MRGEHRNALARVGQVAGQVRSRESGLSSDLNGSLSVDVVIVNWNGRRYLGGCLDALSRANVSQSVHVVDNASTDGSVDFLRASYPHVNVVALDYNAGYAGGANIGLSEGSARYAFVMNADVIVAPGHFQRLIECLESDPTIGVAQGKLLRITPDDFEVAELVGSSTIDSAGHGIRLSRMVIDSGEGEADSEKYSAERSVFSACGAALFLRRSMLEDLAPDGEYFDATFFAYKEDIDLCWRARLLGWDVRYVPNAIAYHVRGWTGKGAPPKSRLSLAARRHSWKNHYLLMLKNDRVGDILRSAPAILGWELVRLVYALVRDPLLFGSYPGLIGQIPSTLRKRREQMARARVEPSAMRRWFGAGRGV